MPQSSLGERIARVEARLAAVEQQLEQLVVELRNERARLEERARHLETWTARHNAVQEHVRYDVRRNISIGSLILAALGTGMGIAATLFGLLR